MVLHSGDNQVFDRLRADQDRQWQEVDRIHDLRLYVFMPYRHGRDWHVPILPVPSCAVSEYLREIGVNIV